MKFRIPENRLKLILVTFLILLGIGTFAYNNYLIDNLLKQERKLIQLWAKAIEYTGRPLHQETRENLTEMIQVLKGYNALPADVREDWINTLQTADSELSNASLELASDIIVQNRFKIPAVVVDEKGNVLFSRNIEEKEVDKQMLQQYREMNAPIRIQIGNKGYQQAQYVYYGESFTVRMLRYFPYLQIGLLALLLGIGYTTYRSISRSERSSLWVGMTKEAAHQLGTPISSLYGWVELLKQKNSEDESTLKIANELENDIKRLQNIAERFNKIGSEPELTEKRIAPVLNQVVDYMERRLPQLGKNVEVWREIDYNPKVKLNTELFQWAVENLVKNAMDAIKTSEGESYVAIKSHKLEDKLIIDVEDSGRGIEKKFHEEIFKPGHSTKQRGWGLGLSLTKRIVEEYHDGQIFVLESSPGEGTTVRIVLEVLEEHKDHKRMEESEVG